MSYAPKDIFKRAPTGPDCRRSMTSQSQTTSVRCSSWITLPATSSVNFETSSSLLANRTNTGRHTMFRGRQYFADCAGDSFLFRKSATLYNRRQSKILTNITSLFTSSYVFNWSKYLPETPLKHPPSFDGRIVLYPSAKEVRDYFSWRQADSECRPLHASVAHGSSQTDYSLKRTSTTCTTRCSGPWCLGTR